MLKVREEQILFWFVGVFTNRAHALDLCLVSMSRIHFEQNMEEFTNSQTLPSEGSGSTSTNTLRRMLPTPHIELLGKRKTWVTLYQEVQMSRSTPNSNDAPKE